MIMENPDDPWPRGYLVYVWLHEILTIFNHGAALDYLRFLKILAVHDLDVTWDYVWLLQILAIRNFWIFFDYFGLSEILLIYDLGASWTTSD